MTIPPPIPQNNNQKYCPFCGGKILFYELTTGYDFNTGVAVKRGYWACENSYGASINKNKKFEYGDYQIVNNHYDQLEQYSNKLRELYWSTHDI